MSEPGGTCSGAARLIRADGAITEYSLARPRISIGSSDGNDIVFQDETISRFHAEIVRCSAEDFRIRDLGSAAGTFVDDAAVKNERVLKPGDVVPFGNVKCFFLAPLAAKSPITQRHWRQVLGYVLALLLLASFLLIDRWVDRIRSKSPRAHQTAMIDFTTPRSTISKAPAS
jgi:hypothetical protein